MQKHEILTAIFTGRNQYLPQSRTLEMSGPPPAAFSPGGLTFPPRNDSLDSIRVSNVEVTIGVSKVASSISEVNIEDSRTPRIVHLTLVIETEDETLTTFGDIQFEASWAQNGTITLNSDEYSRPWKFLIRINGELKQMSISFTLDYGGLSVEQALQALASYGALSKGGKLQVRGRHPVTGGDLPIASAAIPPGSFPGPDDRFDEILEQLAFIQEKTGASFSIPQSDIAPEVLNTIAATARILETGHAEYQAQPWISVSPIEQAKSVLEMFAHGRPMAMAIHFEGQAVPIFGTHVMLGPVTLFCNRTSITIEDLEDLRRQLQNANSETSIRIRYTPFEDCPIEARYVNWLPEDEALSLRQVPMYQKDLSPEDSGTLPITDVAMAVSLLESWYGENVEEQKASWDSIKNALERDRLSDRKLFP